MSTYNETISYAKGPKTCYLEQTVAILTILLLPYTSHYPIINGVVCQKYKKEKYWSNPEEYV